MNTWELVDMFEDRARDRALMPVERYVWKRAHQELVAVLGDRFAK